MNLNDNSKRFDLTSALKRFSGDLELLEEAIAIFAEEAVKHLDEIKIHLEQGKLKEASAISHTLKGECGAVGAVQAYSLSRSMEKVAAEENTNETLKLLPQLEKEISLALELLPKESKQLNL
ncbi:Hpt domain-containing protein [Desulfovibrio sp. JC022]|uniref:Hpt domain-containing protein n=1 Tax=Desulfovibrio sp. JC022 TaxID=2593642 RepID=UPI0013D0A1BA|nr:Hpt domain-containing protein [Desulfovibrio sp. JC022]NDV22400.1 Hpt domain-containing protein [Desulfovibrio sp. JC022]